MRIFAAYVFFFFFKQKTAYEMRISDWSSDVCSSDLPSRAACEGSLQRLGIDTIDLFYQHRVDPAVPIEETVGGMMELVKEGKVRHIALSEAGPDTLRRAAQAAPIAALQSEYSIWEREVDRKSTRLNSSH